MRLFDLRWAVLALGLALAVAFQSPSHGAARGEPTRTVGGAVCLPRDVLVARLSDRFGEHRRGTGVIPGNDDVSPQVLELFVGSSGGWTLFIARADGVACVFVAGEDWRFLDTRQGTNATGTNDPEI